MTKFCFFKPGLLRLKAIMAPGQRTEQEIEHEDRVLIFDDTYQEKPYTDKNKLVCWHYDHTRGQSIKCINLPQTLCWSPIPALLTRCSVMPKASSAMKLLASAKATHQWPLPNAKRQRFSRPVQALAGAIPRRGNPYRPNFLGWRRAFKQHRQITPETLQKADLGKYQYLTVTKPFKMPSIIRTSELRS
jgi:hypothetical protein